MDRGYVDYSYVSSCQTDNNDVLDYTFTISTNPYPTSSNQWSKFNIEQQAVIIQCQHVYYYDSPIVIGNNQGFVTTS